MKKSTNRQTDRGGHGRVTLPNIKNRNPAEWRYRVFIKYCVWFFEDFKIFRTLAFLGFPSVSVCVYTMAGQTPALQQNWQSSEKSQHFKEKHNI